MIASSLVIYDWTDAIFEGACNWLYDLGTTSAAGTSCNCFWTLQCVISRLRLVQHRNTNVYTTYYMTRIKKLRRWHDIHFTSTKRTPKSSKMKNVKRYTNKHLHMIHMLHLHREYGCDGQCRAGCRGACTVTTQQVGAWHTGVSICCSTSHSSGLAVRCITWAPSLPELQKVRYGDSIHSGVWPELQKVLYCEWNNNLWKGITSKPDVRFMPKKDAGTVDIMREKEATATSNSTRMIRLRMVSSCMAHTSRVLSMFSTISCSERHENVKCGQNTVNTWWVDSKRLMSRRCLQCSHSKELPGIAVVITDLVIAIIIACCCYHDYYCELLLLLWSININGIIRLQHMGLTCWPYNWSSTAQSSVSVLPSCCRYCTRSE